MTDAYELGRAKAIANALSQLDAVQRPAAIAKALLEERAQEILIPLPSAKWVEGTTKEITERVTRLRDLAKLLG